MRKINSSEDEVKKLHVPLTKKEEDKFERYYFVQTFVQKILPSKENIFGLEGSWGSGKTTVLNFIKLELESSNAIIIEFNPWYCSDTSQIIPEFMALLNSKLEEEGIILSNSVNNEIKEYQKLLSAEYQSVLELFLVPNKSRKEEFDELNQLLTKITKNKNIYILIDDLDRLEDSEIVETLKLVRLIANFDALNFIVTYDKKHLREALNRIDFNVKYLDKIFPFEITLPQIEGIELTTYLLHHVKQELSDNDLKRLESIDNDVFRGALDSQFTTIRDVMRVHSSFSTSYIFLQGEILVEELLLLEIIKNLYYNVYKNLADGQDDIVSFYTKDGQSNILHLTKDYEEKLKDQELQLTTPTNINRVLKLLRYLFTSNRKRREIGMVFTTYVSVSESGGKQSFEWDPRSIRHEYSHRIYFTSLYNRSKIKISEFIDFLTNDHDDAFLDEKIKEYSSQENSSDFMLLLKDKSLTPIDISYKNLFYTLFELAKPTNPYDSIWLSELLRERLPVTHHLEERDLETKEIYTHLKLLMTSKYQSINPLFLLKIIEDSVNFVPRKLIFETYDEVLEYTNQVFESYLNSDLVDGNYFLFLSNIIKNIYGLIPDQEFDLLDYLRNKYKTDEKAFKSFLRMTIYDPNQEKKTIWTRLYKQYDDLVMDRNIFPVFQRKEGFKNFINSIIEWKDQNFMKNYIEFMDSYFDKEEAIAFDVTCLND